MKVIAGFAAAALSSILLFLPGCAGSASTGTGLLPPPKMPVPPSPPPTPISAAARTGWTIEASMLAPDAPAGRLLWTFDVGSPIWSAPSIGKDTIYVGTDNDYLHAIDKQAGTLKWNAQFSNAFDPPTPAPDNSPLFVAVLDYVYALDAGTGQTRWRFKAEGDYVTAPAVEGGVVYFASVHSRRGTTEDVPDVPIYALNIETGELLWNLRAKGAVRAGPTIADGTLYYGEWPSTGRTDVASYLRAVDLKTRKERWTFPSQEYIDAAPIVADDTIYIQSVNTLSAVSVRNGELRWEYTAQEYVARHNTSALASVDSCCKLDGKSVRADVIAASPLHASLALTSTQTPGPTMRTPPIISEGYVCMGIATHTMIPDHGLVTQEYVVGLDARTGGEIWKVLISEGPVSHLAEEDGLLYFGSDAIYAVDVKTGQARWRFVPLLPDYTAPQVSNGIVYFGDGSGRFYAIGPPQSP